MRGEALLGVENEILNRMVGSVVTMWCKKNTSYFRRTGNKELKNDYDPVIDQNLIFSQEGPTSFRFQRSWYL